MKSGQKINSQISVIKVKYHNGKLERSKELMSYMNLFKIYEQKKVEATVFF